MTQYVESTTPGKVWAYNVHKTPGRPPYACATEGTLGKAGEYGTSFSFMMFQARQHRVALNGNNTPKNRDVAIAKLLADLKDMGMSTGVEVTAP